ncbi:MAG: nuclear transport factor 2 family protein [Acidobacteriota bacterium]|nr:nuclear transport factor 2 family protein [Acidobacteriota bacterium]
MKKFAFINFIFLAFAVAAFGQTTTTTIKPKVVTVTKTPTAKTVTATSVPGEKGVRAAFDRLTEGIRQADAEKVMSVYQNSDNILFFNNNGTVTIGWANMKKNRDASYAKTKNVTLDITGLRVEMLGKDAAYLTCKWKQTDEYDGNLEPASGRMTLIFRMIGKDWKAVHLHTSPDKPDATRPVLPSERENQ